MTSSPLAHLIDDAAAAVRESLALLGRLVAEGVDQPIVMLAGHGTVEPCRCVFKSGAAGFLEKPVVDELLLETLQHAIRRHVRTREREVLGLIVAGLSNKEIGRALAMSPRSVQTHRAKLQAESLAQRVRQYAQLAEGGAAENCAAPRVGGRMAARHAAAENSLRAGNVAGR